MPPNRRRGTGAEHAAGAARGAPPEEIAQIAGVTDAALTKWRRGPEPERGRHAATPPARHRRQACRRGGGRRADAGPPEWPRRRGRTTAGWRRHAGGARAWSAWGGGGKSRRPKPGAGQRAERLLQGAHLGGDRKRHVILDMRRQRLARVLAEGGMIEERGVALNVGRVLVGGRHLDLARPADADERVLGAPVTRRLGPERRHHAVGIREPQPNGPVGADDVAPVDAEPF